MEHIRFDVVVIGSGGAGLRAAVEARLKGREVCVLTKAAPGMGTSTILSAGAFSAAVHGGSEAEHRDWTLRAGRGLNDTDLVDVLVGEAPSKIDELVGWGMRGRAEAGQFVADGPAPVWGKEIVRALLAKARAEGVRFLGSTTACRLHVADGRASILAYNARDNEWMGLSARAVILATGGCSALYARHDNPHRMLGDGYALAFEAGADLKDMEFVQFYPWALAEKGLPVFVMWGQHISMGRVTDEQGRNLFDKYRVEDPPSKDSARDRFSQILFKEIYREGHRITVDLTGVGKEEWCRDHFGRITWELVGDRFGAWRRPLHLAPAAHHTMGGVCIDAAGRTSLPGLFAAGEVTGGLHGANRLGGNALSDTLVFGARAGAAAAEWAASRAGGNPDPPDRDTLPVIPDFGGKIPSPSGRSAAGLKKQLQQTMWEDGGILRNRPGLERALETVGRIRRELHTLHPGAPKTGIQDLIELHHGTRTALLILQAALRREESRGAHFREDFAKPDDERWRGHLRVRKGSDGTAEWVFAKV